MEWHLDLLQQFNQHPQWAIFISIAISILVAVAGLLPSVFVTAANIYFFGFINGTLISAIGEAAGAAVSFLLYRYWFRNRLHSRLIKYKKIEPLLKATGSTAAYWVFIFRLLPFMPSGVVTLAAAASGISLGWFFGASSLGKIPALLLEAALVTGFLHSSWQGQLAMFALAAVLAIFIIKKQNTNKKRGTRK